MEMLVWRGSGEFVFDLQDAGELGVGGLGIRHLESEERVLRRTGIKSS